MIVGRSAQLQFSGLDIGIEAEFGQNHWKVVGIFEADGSISESEIWADAAVLAPAYRRGSSYQNAVGEAGLAGQPAGASRTR